MPRFLTIDNVLMMHARVIERYGGDPGLRDLSLLESAVNMPSSGIGGEFFHSDVFGMAAAYLFHIVLNHPFLDGNKRTGLAAATAFLRLNGYILGCTNAELSEMVLMATAGKMEKDMVADFFRSHCILL